jgi:hypothetical protein
MGRIRKGKARTSDSIYCFNLELQTKSYISLEPTNNCISSSYKRILSISPLKIRKSLICFEVGSCLGELKSSFQTERLLSCSHMPSVHSRCQRGVTSYFPLQGSLLRIRYELLKELRFNFLMCKFASNRREHSLFLGLSL